MADNNNTSKRIRVGLFYDGCFLAKVSNFYKFEHYRRSRLSMRGMCQFIQKVLADHYRQDGPVSVTVDAHYFIGRPSVDQLRSQYPDGAQRLKRLEDDRAFDLMLSREDVQLHPLPLGAKGEKGVDILFALSAAILAEERHFHWLVLLTGDGDFVPLARHARQRGLRVMLLGWDFDYTSAGRRYSTHTASALIDQVDWPLFMATEIDRRLEAHDCAVNGLFVDDRARSQLGTAA
jgi:hypothetical protein